jgi:hypothetical protein
MKVPPPPSQHLPVAYEKNMKLLVNITIHTYKRPNRAILSLYILAVPSVGNSYEYEQKMAAVNASEGMFDSSLQCPPLPRLIIALLRRKHYPLMHIFIISSSVSWNIHKCTRLFGTSQVHSAHISEILISYFLLRSHRTLCQSYKYSYISILV